MNSTHVTKLRTVLLYSEPNLHFHFRSVSPTCFITTRHHHKNVVTPCGLSVSLAAGEGAMQLNCYCSGHISSNQIDQRQRFRLRLFCLPKLSIERGGGGISAPKLLSLLTYFSVTATLNTRVPHSTLQSRCPQGLVNWV